MLIEYIFSKYQITLLVFSLRNGICPEFWVLMIFCYTNIALCNLNNSIVFNSNSLCIWRISLNIRKLINSLLYAFHIVLFKLVFIWFNIWINLNFLIICLPWWSRSTFNRHSIIFWPYKWRWIVLLHKWLVFLCNKTGWRWWIKIMFFLV